MARMVVSAMNAVIAATSSSDQKYTVVLATDYVASDAEEKKRASAEPTLHFNTIAGATTAAREAKKALDTHTLEASRLERALKSEREFQGDARREFEEAKRELERLRAYEASRRLRVEDPDSFDPVSSSDDEHASAPRTKRSGNGAASELTSPIGASNTGEHGDPGSRNTVTDHERGALDRFQSPATPRGPGTELGTKPDTEAETDPGKTDLPKTGSIPPSSAMSRPVVPATPTAQIKASMTESSGEGEPSTLEEDSEEEAAIAIAMAASRTE